MSDIKIKNPDFRQTLRNLIRIVDNGGIPEAKQVYGTVKAMMEAEGYGSGALTKENFVPMKDGDDACVIWYAGQFMDIVENEAWFAMNSFINCHDRFCPLSST